jgi:hypothetical protein
MKKFSVNVIAVTLGFACSAGALAEGMSKDDYKAGKDRIAAEYKSDTAGCASLSGNPNDICVAEAKGKEKIARAELEATYKPNRKTHYQARVAKAEADYAVAQERCDDKAGNAKDVCVKEAKAAQTAAKADAKMQVQISDANDTANEKSAEARSEANNQAASARQDAAADKLEAQYRVAKEKCDLYAGGAKDICLDRAKERFGKS